MTTRSAPTATAATTPSSPRRSRRSHPHPHQRPHPRRDAKALHIQPIPVPANAHHPSVPHADTLLQHPFTIGVIAPKGSGKTTWIARNLSFYQGYFHHIIVFSPTIYADEKWDWVRKQPLLGQNKKLQKWLEAQDKEQDDLIIQKPKVVRSPPAFSPYIPDECFIVDYDENTLLRITQEQDEKVNAIKELGGTVHLADRILWIFDDLVGSSLFSNKKDNGFKILNTRHRHFNSSLMMVSQGYREIPKTVRTNWSGLILFRILSDGELDSIRNEYPMGMPRALWDAAFTHCTSDDYGFLFYNTQRTDKRLRVMHNYNEFVFVE